MEIDLNLLKILQVLLEERNVTRTADRLFVSQSAISKSLRRLRQIFGDPLLVRSSRGLVPTAKALELAGPINEAIVKLNSLYKPQPFNPATAQGRLRIAAQESFVLAISSRFVLALKEAAPKLIVEFMHLPDDHAALLEAGSLDFVIYLDQKYPEGIVAHRLRSELPAVWFREGHPLSKKKELTLADICSYPTIRFHSGNVTLEDSRYFDEAIAKLGLTRTDYMSTSHLLIAFDLLSKSNAVVTAPEHLSRMPAFVSGVVSRSMTHLPVIKKLQMNLALIQHERTLSSPLHKWIATEIEKAFDALGSVKS